MIQGRDQTIKRALEVAREQSQGDADAYLSRLMGTLDGTLGDALTFCWGTIRQIERYANVPTLSTPRDFGLHYVEEHLLFTVANDALSHLDLVERLLHQVKSFCQQDVTPHISMHCQLLALRPFETVYERPGTFSLHIATNGSYIEG